MTDAQTALAKVREALAAGPTPGPWVMMPANAGVHCVARINAWEAVPPSDCELSHDSIDASFIAACSPANMTAILAHVEAQAAEIERLRAERDELRRQLAEAELDAARYQWLRGDSCPYHSVRWAKWEVRCWRAPQWTADLRRSDLDAAIDAARSKEQK